MQQSMKRQPILNLNNDDYLKYKAAMERQKNFLSSNPNILKNHKIPAQTFVIANHVIESYKEGFEGKGMYIGEETEELLKREIPIYVTVVDTGTNDIDLKKGDLVILNKDALSIASFVYKNVRFVMFSCFNIAIKFDSSEANYISGEYKVEIATLLKEEKQSNTPSPTSSNNN